MNNALKFLKDLKKSRDYDGNLENALDKAIEELEEFGKECENLVIESQRLVNETLDLGDIIIKQRKRISELETQLNSAFIREMKDPSKIKPYPTIKKG